MSAGAPDPCAAAPPIEGVEPSSGAPASVRAVDGLLVFLTSTCLGCRGIWEALSGGGAPDVAPITALVTPDPTLEDRRAVASLAPAGVPVVMSTAAWLAYRAGPSPYAVSVRSGGVVAARAVTGWADLVSFAAGDPFSR